MSDLSPGPDWWLASDGRWYPPSSPPGGAPVGATAPLPGAALSPVLAVVLQVAFAFTAAMYGFAVVLTARARSTFSTYWFAPVEDDRLWQAAVDAEDRLVAFGPLSLAANLVLLVLLVVWMFQSHGIADRLRPGSRRWTRGWTIGGWFIPIANLFMPKRVMNEIERIATAPRVGGVLAPGWQQTRTSAIGWVWWVTFVACWLGVRIATGMYSNAFEQPLLRFDPNAVLDAYGLAIACYALAIVAAVSGAVYVGRISRRLSPAAFAATYDEDPHRHA